jgi:hypothetical protein
MDEQHELPTKKIRPIDLKPGMDVIVSRWFDAKEYEFRELGAPLRVMAVALPYMTCKHLLRREKIIMDTRLSEFILVDKRYVRSLVRRTPRVKTRLLTEEEKILRTHDIKHVYDNDKMQWKYVIVPKK